VSHHEYLLACGFISEEAGVYSFDVTHGRSDDRTRLIVRKDPTLPAFEFEMHCSSYGTGAFVTYTTTDVREIAALASCCEVDNYYFDHGIFPPDVPMIEFKEIDWDSPFRTADFAEYQCDENRVLTHPKAFFGDLYEAWLHNFDKPRQLHIEPSTGLPPGAAVDPLAERRADLLGELKGQIDAGVIGLADCAQLFGLSLSRDQHGQTVIRGELVDWRVDDGDPDELSTAEQEPWAYQITLRDRAIDIELIPSPSLSPLKRQIAIEIDQGNPRILAWNHDGEVSAYATVSPESVRVEAGGFDPTSAFLDASHTYTSLGTRTTATRG